MVNSQNSKWGNVGSKGKSNHAGSSYVKKNVGPSPGMSKGKSIDGSLRGKQDLWQLSKDSSFKPKVLVRGSSQKTNPRVDVSMKPEFELDATTNMKNGAAHASNVSNEAFGSRSGNISNLCEILHGLFWVILMLLWILLKSLLGVPRLKKELATIQSTMVSKPFSSDLREAKLSCLKAFKEALKDEELFLRQKSKIEWLSDGD
nr:hypothetical protein [Tanacetum cinerariifolium]